MAMRSPMSRVKGLGSSHDGVGRWWAERLSALALVPLLLWFVYSAVTLVGADYQTFRAWVGEHGNAVLLILLALSMLYHTGLGLQVIFEDYMESERLKFVSILLLWFVIAICAVSNVLAVLHLAFGS